MLYHEDALIDPPSLAGRALCQAQGGVDIATIVRQPLAECVLILILSPRANAASLPCAIPYMQISASELMVCQWNQ